MEKDINIDETTSSGSAAGSASYVGYAGPAAWSKNGKPISKPMYVGGTVLSESNYLTDSNFFSEYVKLINEETDINYIKDNNDGYGNLDNMSKENIDIIKTDIEKNKIEENNDNLDSVKNKAIKLSKEEGDVKDFASTKHDKLPEKVEETTILEPLQDTMANTNNSTGIQSNNVEMGTNNNGGLSESELLKNINNELSLFTKYHNNLMEKVIKEDRKPSAIVLKDRLGKENQKNFTTDFNNSSTSNVIKIEKVLQYKDDITTIDDPNKLGQDIEKEILKKQKGNRLKMLVIVQIIKEMKYRNVI